MRPLLAPLIGAMLLLVSCQLDRDARGSSRDAGVRPRDTGTAADGRVEEDAGSDAGELMDAGRDAAMSEDAGADAAEVMDTGVDTGVVDTGPQDAGRDAGQDTGPPDVGMDAGCTASICESSCSGSDCTCSSTDDCSLGCSADCLVTCSGQSSCEVRVDGNHDGELDCGGNAVCVLRAGSGASNVRATCAGNAVCEIECDSTVSNCLEIDCSGNAECLVTCEDPAQTNCGFENCSVGAFTCADGVLACNRACP